LVVEKNFFPLNGGRSPAGQAGGIGVKCFPPPQPSPQVGGNFEITIID